MFLDSLAANENHKTAIAVLLSGAGTDGTKGTQKWITSLHPRIFLQ
jgi:chemotaxis response regulator CheB